MLLSLCSTTQDVQLSPNTNHWAIPRFLTLLLARWQASCALSHILSIFQMTFSPVGKTQHTTLMQDDRTKEQLLGRHQMAPNQGATPNIPQREQWLVSHILPQHRLDRRFLDYQEIWGAGGERSTDWRVRGSVTTGYDTEEERITRVSATVLSVCSDWNAWMVAWRESSRRWPSSGPQFLCGACIRSLEVLS